jgi:hypothetical protein
VNSQGEYPEDEDGALGRDSRPFPFNIAFGWGVARMAGQRSLSSFDGPNNGGSRLGVDMEIVEAGNDDVGSIIPKELGRRSVGLEDETNP